MKWARCPLPFPTARGSLYPCFDGSIKKNIKNQLFLFRSAFFGFALRVIAGRTHSLDQDLPFPCTQAPVGQLAAQRSPPAPNTPASRPHRGRSSRGGGCASPSWPIPVNQSPTRCPLRCLSKRLCQQARQKTASSAEAPLPPPDSPSCALTSPSRPLIEGAVRRHPGRFP